MNPLKWHLAVRLLGGREIVKPSSPDWYRRGSTDLVHSGNSVHVAENTAEATPPSRRQENKRRTELGLQHVALELFAKNGYDATTTDEIAERAGVSPRTFFRYFPTKESVLFLGRYAWFQSFTEQYLAQPPSLTDVEAILESLLALAPQLSSRRRSLLLYDRAVASSPTLRGGVFDHQQEDMDTLARAIARRTRPGSAGRALVAPGRGVPSHLPSIDQHMARRPGHCETRRDRRRAVRASGRVVRPGAPCSSPRIDPLGPTQGEPTERLTGHLSHVRAGCISSRF